MTQNLRRHLLSCPQVHSLKDILNLIPLLRKIAFEKQDTVPLHEVSNDHNSSNLKLGINLNYVK